MPQFRQGDVFVQQVRPRSISGTAISDQGRVILAYGEVTGHSHQVVEADTTTETMSPAQLFEEPDGTRYLFVDRPCLLVHQEHAPIALTPGCWKVTRQREYQAQDISRPVAD